jgi:hypothetical protein
MDGPSMEFTNVIWIFFIFAALQPMFRQRMLEALRKRKIVAIEAKRNSRAILLVHRQETMSFLGFPVLKFINMDDAEAVIHAIDMTDPDVPIDLILHTPGGLALASFQIARAINARPGKVTVFIPHYAMSGGTLIALAADEIVMSKHAVLGPVDPQLGEYPAASILRVLRDKPAAEIEDRTLILADQAEKALNDLKTSVTEILGDARPPDHGDPRAGTRPQRKHRDAPRDLGTSDALSPTGSQNRNRGIHAGTEKVAADRQLKRSLSGNAYESRRGRKRRDFEIATAIERLRNVSCATQPFATRWSVPVDGQRVAAVDSQKVFSAPIDMMNFGYTAVFRRFVDAAITEREQRQNAAARRRSLLRSVVLVRGHGHGQRHARPHSPLRYGRSATRRDGQHCAQSNAFNKISHSALLAGSDNERSGNRIEEA